MEETETTGQLPVVEHEAPALPIEQTPAAEADPVETVAEPSEFERRRASLVGELDNIAGRALGHGGHVERLGQALHDLVQLVKREVAGH